MAHARLRYLVIAGLALSALSPVSAAPAAAGIVTDLRVVLQPGVWHGYWLGPSATARGYLVEITPLKPSTNGAHIAEYGVRPEYDGMQWNDVLRVRLPAELPALSVHIRVYQTDRLPLAADFETVLAPGVWHGFGLGSAAQARGYVAEVTPLEPAREGAALERVVVQPEFDGASWNDVLRAQWPADQAPLRVHVRVYQTGPLPAAQVMTVVLQPGEWQGYALGASARPGAYLAEVTPLEPARDGATLEHVGVQPEFDGTTWQDVLRLQWPADQAPLRAEVRVYGPRP